MAFQQVVNIRDAKCSDVLFLVIKSCFLMICFFQSAIGSEIAHESIHIGAIIDVDSRAGKEQKTAMMIAVQSFNNISTSHKLDIHFLNTSNNPIQSVSAAEELIRENQVQVIIGMQTWEQAVLVADVGKKAQVPVLSLASASNRNLFMQERWPFLVPLVSNSLEQISSIASIIRSYHWRKVIAIYEDNTYGGDSEMLALLSEALQPVDAEIEAHLVFPPMSSVSDPEGIVREEVEKLLATQSRVFIVLRSSLSLANHLFREARKLGFMGRDSVWILAESLSDLLDSVDTEFISSAQGALGTKLYYSEKTKAFLDFKRQFQTFLRLEFPNEYKMEPGIHALQAYDGITAITKAVMELGNEKNACTSMLLLTKIRSNNFTGLTGDVHFHNESLSSQSIFTIVNVVGKRYKELGLWSSNFGFAHNGLKLENGKTRNLSAVTGVQTMQELPVLVHWPGELNRTPRGWAMPSIANPMKIGIPGRTVFEKFVKVDWNNDKNTDDKYDGFCIVIFQEILKVLEQDYTLPHEFIPFNGTYEQLIDNVFNQSYDAVVGDITILANRSNYVDFTHPFIGSGLSMLVPVKHEARGWLFMKPFSLKMWIATFSIMLYTMLVVWYIELHKNEGSRAPWRDQLAAAIWFTWSTLFFAHKENPTSNYSKAVLIWWLVLVYIVTSSYQASLTSMLTIQKLQPNVTDVEWIKRTNAPVGCDPDSFVLEYLKNVIGIHNIKPILNQEDYPGEFKSGNITASFLELPYQNVFLKEYCNQFTTIGPTDRFGGQGFAFQKGSPIARDFSKAILTLQENGKLKRIQDDWLGSSMNCSGVDDSSGPKSLGFDSFWGLYLISGSTSTICILICIVKNNWKHQVAYQNGAVVGGKGIKGVLDMIVELAPISRSRTFGRRLSSREYCLGSPADPSEGHFESTPEYESKLV